MSKICFHIALLFFAIKVNAQVSITMPGDTSLFIGLENKVWIKTKNYPLNELYIVLNGRKNKGVNGEFRISCSSPQRNVPIYVYYKSKIIATKIIQINRVADPEVFVFSNTIIKDSVISIKEIPRLSKLVVKNNVPFLGIYIRSFSIKRIVNGTVADSVLVKGNVFDITAKRVLSKVQVGNKIIFADIDIQDCIHILHRPILLNITD